MMKILLDRRDFCSYHIHSMETILKDLVYLPPRELKMVCYDKTQDYMKTSVAYQGILHKHHYKTDTVILMDPPLSQSTVCYEFKVSDITKIEELPSIVTETGESIRMVKLWVRKGSLGLRMQAFEVLPETAREHQFPSQARM